MSVVHLFHNLDVASPTPAIANAVIAGATLSSVILRHDKKPVFFESRHDTLRQVAPTVHRRKFIAPAKFGSPTVPSPPVCGSSDVKGPLNLFPGSLFKPNYIGI